MSSVQQSVTRLIESARRLRDVAGQLDNAELKAQIVDEISTLQDLREDLVSAGDTTVDLPAAMVAQPSDVTDEKKSTPLGDNSMSVYTPSKNTGTYSLTEEEEPVEVVADKSKTASTPPVDDPEKKARRAAEAEKVIAELETILQDAIRSMNDTLTPEQKKIKVRATKAGEAAGKTAGEIRNSVFAAMKLSDEQKIRISDARKQITQLRASIAEEVTFLMDDQQRAQVKGESHSR